MNFNNNRWLFFVTLVLLAANVLMLALLWTNGKNAHAPDRPAPLFEFVTAELDLNKAQQDAYRQLRQQHQAMQRPLMDSIRRAKDEFFDLLNVPGVSDSLINVYSRRAMLLQQQMEIVNFKHFQEVRALCSEGQQKKFDTIIKEVFRRMSGPKPPPGVPPHEE